LKRAAAVLERLAYLESGLNDALVAAIPRQEALLARFHSLSLPSSLSARSPNGVTALETYEGNNLLLQSALGTLRATAEESALVDTLVRDISQFGYDVTQSIATESQRRSREWEAGRPTVRLPAVTAECLTAYLRGRFPEHPFLRVTKVIKLVGMNANEAFYVDIEGHPKWPARLILRRSLAARIQPRSIVEEFEILEVMHGSPVPVPRPIFCDADPAVLGRPFVALERLSGQVQVLTEPRDRGRRIYLKVAGLLAKLHGLDSTLLPHHRRADGESALAWLNRRIDNWESEWRRGAREPVHTVAAAFYWLRRHASEFVDQSVIVHGDLDQRNILVDGEDIIALIDWEVAHEGHPAEDLAYLREEVESVMPWTEFIAAYQAQGGRSVTEAQLRYGTVLSNMLRVTTSMIAHVAYLDGVVDNFLMGTVRTLETEAACQRLHNAIYG
jgi:aminoglycoside phosphotransferase (APT) family kinase protein